MISYEYINHPSIRFSVSPVVKLNLPEHAFGRRSRETPRTVKLGRQRTQEQA